MITNIIIFLIENFVKKQQLFSYRFIVYMILLGLKFKTSMNCPT